METRVLHQVKIYKLVLNDMRSPKIEHTEIAAVATTPRALTEFMEREREPESYSDGTWGKVFRKGGPLEWYNSPFDSLGQGIQEEWVSEETFESFVKPRYLFIEEEQPA